MHHQLQAERLIPPGFVIDYAAIDGESVRLSP